ncbi:SDR family oxidoreductase [Desulfovibrio sp. ZJ369]|uniref:NAD-dependent epimerase/dehydratase family protein n=1 Tax=Desulfovibrio sp. ZJ369 TaxID=2709793 RepID=UPI0013EA784A|nr:SDR family oxidoreductase [Desulfovibrio sp. ZJ369]
MKLLVTGISGLLGKQVRHLLTFLPQITSTFVVRHHPVADNELYWDFQKPLPEGLKFDALLHMASVIDYTPQSSVLHKNTLPAISLLDAVKRNDSNVYFTSTASIHGQHFPWAIDSPVEPADDYAFSKLVCERIFQALPERVCIFRLNGIYGFQNSSHLGINRAIYQALVSKKKPELFGEGAQLRNYISDISAAQWILHEVLQKERKSKIVYMAGSETLSIKSWLKTIAEILLEDDTIDIYPGRDNLDVLVHASHSPVQMPSFSDYLKKLRKQYENMLLF